MRRSSCSYDQDSDSYAVTIKELDVRGERFNTVTCYRAPGSYIRKHFDWQTPLNGDDLARAIEFTAKGLGA